MKFHDGSPMTTADVIYSLKRNLNPNSYWAFAYANVKSIDQTGPWEVTVRDEAAGRDVPRRSCPRRPGASGRRRT